MSADKPQIRKIYTFIEQTHSEGTVQLDKPACKAAAAAVFKNPYAGKYQEDLSLLYEWSEQLGEMLTQKAVAALGIEPAKVHSYGKGAIAGGKGPDSICQKTWISRCVAGRAAAFQRCRLCALSF